MIDFITDCTLFGLFAMLCPSPVHWFNVEHIILESMMLSRCHILLSFHGRNRGRQIDHKGERTQRIYRWYNHNQTDTNRYNSLTSRQLVILETNWAPWQHRMNPARLRSTHTTDSRTNTLTWRWRHGGREVGWKKGGKMDYCGLNTCAWACGHIL